MFSQLSLILCYPFHSNTEGGLKKQEREKLLLSVLSRLKDKMNAASEIENKFSLYRFAIFALGMILVLITFFYISNDATLIVIIFFLIAFLITAHLHSRLSAKIKRLKRWITIKETHIARMNLEWDKIPNEFTDYKKISAVERDLNLAGDKSLIHLISTCVTKKGWFFLRSLLSISEPDYNQIRERQKLVRELSSLNKFRDKLTLVSGNAKSGEISDEVLEWLNSKNNVRPIKNFFIFLTSFAILNIILVLGHTYNLIPSYWGITVPLYLGVYYYQVRKISKTSKNAELLKEQIGRFSSVFDFLEAYSYRKESALEKFVSGIIETENKPSQYFKKAERYLEVMNMRANPLLWFLIILIFPMDFFIGYKTEICKNKISEKFDSWLNIWYQLDAYNSLANFAYLNPEYNFPDFIENPKENNYLLEAKSLGHPLIPDEVKIENDFEIRADNHLLIFTGSNMSGKSTFLRTIGINVLLSYSGAPVDSKSFTLHLMKVFTCINVTDSVVDGISYFYAEVKRLKELLNELNGKSKMPVLFLIDEIFKGTNNIERLKGSQAYVKELLKKNAAGIIATHDLELTRLADDHPEIKNYHFREEISYGKMVFTYNLYSGPCPTTNALKIMEMEGLPVLE